MPHPFIFSLPVAKAAVGKTYRCQVRTLASLGDYQHRYEEPGNKFWQRENYKFELVKGPAWLKLDADSGALGGKPGREDAGQEQVTVQVTNETGGRATQEFLLSVE